VQKFKQMLVFSPTDLTTFMTSPFASWMNRFALENPSNTPTKDAEDAFNKLLADKGIQHENQTLLQFKSQGLNVINIESVVSETHKNISHKVNPTSTLTTVTH
jgi:hypothetical protein